MPDQGETFAADWLALREPVDHRSRNEAVTQALLDHLVHRPGDRTMIIDMGCGTGSTLRALAPPIAAKTGRPQRWVLLDADAALLEEAERQVSVFLGSQPIARLTVSYRQLDLADTDALAALATRERCDVLTGSALIDLVSAAWLDAILDIAEANQAALLFALNYGGTERWSPPSEHDAAVLAGFNADQRRDKGFGLALGADAVAHLSRSLSGRAFKSTGGDSDWRLGKNDRALMTMLAEGIAEAAVRGGCDAESAGRWLQARREAAGAVIAHRDIVAVLA